MQTLTNGKYLYLGMKSFLTQLSDNRNAELEINIDGLPLFKSSKMQLWPILGCINNSEPFVVSIFCGDRKPPLEEFFEPFVNEVLQENQITLTKVICDSPARAMVKCIKSHTGYSSCDKCNVVGEYDKESKQVVFTSEGSIRTDAHFRSQTDRNHHKGVSPLLRLPIDMVMNLPYDPMHLLYLGVMKRLLTFWDIGPRRTRFSATMKSSLSDVLIKFVAYFPTEFARKPRSLEYLKYFKATEFRYFLLYTGCVALKDFCSSDMYFHFLTLHCAAVILSDDNMFLSQNDRANDCLRDFVDKCRTIYGKRMMSYNIHALLHLAGDCLRYGPLDKFSAFKYENALKGLKSKVRGGNLPIEQLEKRLSESERVLRFSVHEGIIYKGRIRNVINVHDDQFQKVVIGDHAVFSTNICDSHFMDSDQNYYRIFCVIRSSNQPLFNCKKYSCVRSFFVRPFDSLKLNIARISKLSKEFYLLGLDKVAKKCVALPYHNDLVVLPMSSL